MKTIYKYPLKAVDEQRIELPVGAEILSVKLQNERPCLWALVDKPKLTSTSSIESRLIITVGTGHSISKKNLKFIDTVLMHNDSLVLHFFESI